MATNQVPMSAGGSAELGESSTGVLVWQMERAGAVCEVRLHECAEGPVAQCAGELCFTTVEPLGAALFELINRRGPSLRLEMSGVTFIDARGVSLLVRLHHAVTELGGELEVLRPSRQVRRLLEVVGAEQLLDDVTGWPGRPAPR